jgi:hypothetical protein
MLLKVLDGIVDYTKKLPFLIKAVAKEFKRCGSWEQLLTNAPSIVAHAEYRLLVDDESTITQAPSFDAICEELFLAAAVAESNRLPGFTAPWPALKHQLRRYLYCVGADKILHDRPILNMRDSETSPDYSAYLENLLGDLAPTVVRQKWYGFFQWFTITVRRICELKPVWCAPDRLIEGFISKVNCVDLLRNARPGTFILRFSDKNPGDLAVAVLTDDNVVSHHLIQYVSTTEGKGWEISIEKSKKHIYPCLADLMQDCDNLVKPLGCSTKDLFTLYAPRI